MTRDVYIATELTRQAEVYHTDPDCNKVEWIDLTQITEQHAKRHGVRLCRDCAGLTSLNPIQRKLVEMDPDDIPMDGGKA